MNNRKASRDYQGRGRERLPDKMVTGIKYQGKGERLPDKMVKCSQQLLEEEIMSTGGKVEAHLFHLSLSKNRAIG